MSTIAPDTGVFSQNGQPRQHFHALLTPHRSLGPAGFLILMGFFAGVSFFAGLFFYSIGAWPVMGFFGLDAALLYLAFRLNYRGGRGCEIIELDIDQLRITRIDPEGKRTIDVFNPYWARVEMVEQKGDVAEIRLVAQKRSIVVAAFLSDPERREFAAALQRALINVRASHA